MFDLYSFVEFHFRYLPFCLYSNFASCIYMYVYIYLRICVYLSPSLCKKERDERYVLSTRSTSRRFAVRCVKRCVVVFIFRLLFFHTLFINNLTPEKKLRKYNTVQMRLPSSNHNFCFP